jgi:hypothetical protein
MLRQVRRAVPRTWTALVLADRGLDARWLCRRITRLGWHPFVRLNTGGTFRPTGQVRGVPLKTLVPEPGTTWQGTGIARVANRSDLLEVGERLHKRTSTPLSPMFRLVHILAPACHVLLCPCLLMAPRGPQGLLSSRLALIGARDRDAQQPFCYASMLAWITARAIGRHA